MQRTKRILGVPGLSHNRDTTSGTAIRRELYSGESCWEAGRGTGRAPWAPKGLETSGQKNQRRSSLHQAQGKSDKADCGVQFVRPGPFPIGSAGHGNGKAKVGYSQAHSVRPELPLP